MKWQNKELRMRLKMKNNYDNIPVFWELFKKNLSEEELDDKIKSFEYSLTMFWQQRPDKLFSDHYPLYIATTNLCHGDKRKHLLSNTYLPLANAESLFSDFSHRQLAKECGESIKEYYAFHSPFKPLKKDKKWWFFSK